jgi:hypothetical protein
LLAVLEVAAHLMVVLQLLVLEALEIRQMRLPPEVTALPMLRIKVMMAVVVG